jgi:3-dehydroquinate dehydratase type I
MKADLLEIRFDLMKFSADLYEIRDVTDLPLIATNRRRDQGGLSVQIDADRVSMLMDACDAGFDFVDIELSTKSISEVVEKIKAKGKKIIVSHHDLESTPKLCELKKIMLDEIALGADICKIVGTSNSTADNLTYLRFLVEKKDDNLVSFGMGELGAMSRIFSPFFGGAYTYASLETGKESAPGQLTIAGLKEIYRILGA